MNNNIYINITTNSKNPNIPTKELLESWVCAAIRNEKYMAELCLLIVNKPEGKQLNYQWRNKNYATNILSFPAEIHSVVQPEVLGDLVACAPIIEYEAKSQGKNVTAHWAHIIIHGTLHLLGYDHDSDEEAKIMEDLEVTILHSLGYNNPYLV